MTRMTYVGEYTRKDGVVVKGHYRRVTQKAIESAKWNLSKRKIALCHNTEYIYDLKEGYGYASFGICGFMPQKRKEEKKVVDSDRTTLLSEDYGPQRFCSKCRKKLEVYWDHKTDENVYLGCECMVWKFFNPLTMEWYGGKKEARKSTGQPVHNDWTMDELKETYKSLKGKDADWYKENKGALKEIYKEHADDAGKMEKETLPLLYNEDGEVISDLSHSQFIDRMESGLEINNLTELTKEEVYLMNYASKVLAFNAYKVRTKVKDSSIREVLKEHLLDLCDIFIELEFRHPKVYRYKRKCPKTWKELEGAILEEEMWVHQDWEYESRLHLAMIA